MKAFLFDIDGTLIRTGGAGMGALGKIVHASEAMTTQLRGMRLDGMTDRAICRALLAAQQPGPAPVAERAAQVTLVAIDALIERYLAALEAALPEYAGKLQIHAGVEDALAALHGRGAIVGLATGNVVRGAELKLGAVGLWRHFDPARSGFGSDAEDRAELVRVGVERTGCPATDVLIIGDTPRDVAAAHDAGAPCLGVATGRFTVHDLAESGADVVAETLAAPSARRALGIDG